MKAVRATICQYDLETDQKINEYTGTANQIFGKIKNYKNYYYRLKIFENTSREKIEDNHLGLKVTNIGSLEITREDHLNARLNNYVQNLIREDNKRYNNDYLENLIYWYFVIESGVLWRKTLDKNEFYASLNEFLKENKDFKEISDLNSLKGKSGIYVMVLEKYRGFYIGQSKDMKKRIQYHWNRKNYFTGTGIDFYKAKDTTKVYAKVIDEKNLDEYEKVCLEKLVKYSLNVIPAGSLETIKIDELSSLLQNKIRINDIFNTGTWVVEQMENNKNLLIYDKY